MAMVSSKGALVAVAVAGLFGCAGGQSSAGKSTVASTTATPVQCSGINSCKGQGSCRGNENACKAKNDCKAKGWVETASAGDCAAKGGTAL
jgi:hypothetical protein